MLAPPMLQVVIALSSSCREPAATEHAARASRLTAHAPFPDSDFLTSHERQVVPIIQANGCNFYYELSGQGPDLVFIHGEIHGVEYWEYQIPELAREHRCFAYNRRGHARTELTDFGFSLVNQTRDLARLIELLGIERPVIIAVAFGTTIAASYAIQFPARVRGMVLVAWSELHDSMQYFQRWKSYNEEATRIIETGGRQAFVSLLRRDAGKRIYRVIPLEDPVREKAIQMFASHPLEEFRHGMLELGSSVPDLVPQFRSLDLPVLGLCGSNDPYPDQPEVLAGMRNFREAPSIEGAGRFVHWERPAEFNAVVRGFLQQLA
jgi:3-oxoadipate enol-lactonase